nr:hypothetical protein CFP56_57411 [Quercus suber]
MDDEKIQVAYYQGQIDCIILKKAEVEQNLQVYFTKRWTVALDKMQVEATSTLRGLAVVMLVVGDLASSAVELSSGGLA